MPFPSSGDLPDTGIEPGCPALHADALPSEPPAKANMFVYMCGLPRWHGGKESACQCKRRKRRGFDPCVRKIPWRRKWKPTLVSLPGKFHGQRSLVGYIQSIGSKRVRHDSAHTHTEYVCTTESLCCTSEINMTL